MIIIGEKLNSSIASFKKLLDSHDLLSIDKIINAQIDAGAFYIDVNTATMGESEPELIYEISMLISKHRDVGVFIDSSNPDTIETAVNRIVGEKLFSPDQIVINSINAGDSAKRLFSLVSATGTKAVILPMQGYVGQNAEIRYSKACELLDMAHSEGISDDRIMIDALIEPVSINPDAPVITLNTIKLLKKRIPKCLTVCGISNVSYGMPARYKLNAAFLKMALDAGLDSAIIDPCIKAAFPLESAVNALSGDEDALIDFIHENR